MYKVEYLATKISLILRHISSEKEQKIICKKSKLGN
jgi:hypothetical protein